MVMTDTDGRARYWLLALALLVLWVGQPTSVLAQDSGDGAGETGESEEKELTPEEIAAAEKAREEARALAEKRERIADLFSATSVEWDKETGDIVLIYRFEEADQSVALDWGPPIEKFKKRVKWSRGWEGGSRSYRSDTIIVAEYGTWLHKAEWKNVSMDLEVHMLTEIMKKGDLLAAVYAWDKGKKMVGSNIGEQLVRLNAGQGHRGKPMPTAFPLLHADERRTFGYKLKDGVLAATQGKRQSVTTRDNPKFLKKIKPGHVGITWKGTYMKAAVIQTVIRGTLDPKWVEKELDGKI